MGLKIYFILKFHMLVLKIFFFSLFLAGSRVVFLLASQLIVEVLDLEVGS